MFAVQCLAYVAFCLALVSYFRARTVADTQATLDRFVTIGVLVHVVSVQFYACLSARRDLVLRALVTGPLLVLAILHQWAPLRGTVIELQTVQLPGGVTGVVPIRTPAGAPLVVLYLAVLATHVYGFFIARTIWKRDRAGGFLIAFASAVILLGAALGFLVDFARVRVPYAGAWPHGVFVVCVSLFLAREYGSRGARVAATRRLFQSAFEHAPIGKALLALDGRFLEVNRALSRLLDRSVEELCARRLRDVMHPEDGAEEPGLQRLSEAQAYTVERRLLRKDGEVVWVLLAVAAVADEHGRHFRIIAQVQDVTELRAHRERLEELVATRTRELSEAKEAAESGSRAKSQFLAHMSHEIRNPLHVILAYAESLERDRALGDAQRTKIGIVRSSGKHLQTIINDVLEMSRLEAGRLELLAAPFDPWATLVEIERMFAGEAAAKALELTIERAPELPVSMLGDGAKVKQIVINLTSNALKFTNHGSIRLHASASVLESGSVLAKVVVADTGIGIAAHETATIFQPFEQLEPGRRAGGSGLGLAISLAHARRMGGDLTVESDPGVGSTFTLTFVAKPVAEATRVSEAAPRLVAPGPTRCKVLVVDDMPINRDALSELFTQAGFETRTAADGAAALAIHAAWEPHLVLMDLRMPGMGGLEAIRQLRAAGSTAALGALSASAFDEDERRALALGANFFLRKPYDYGELLSEIARVLAPVPDSSELETGPSRPHVPSAERGDGTQTGGRSVP